MTDYTFTTDWFSHNIPTWKAVLPQRNIKQILEIGSYEGRSTVWLIENILPVVGGIRCIDLWEDPEPNRRFMDNIDKCRAKYPRLVNSHKGKSIDILSFLITRIAIFTFDLVYIDGSHKASDVLTDLCLSFQLLKPGGLMICDDYLGGEWRNPLDQPKMAIDAFVNCHLNQVRVLPVSGYQTFIEKFKDHFGFPQLYV